MAGQSINDRLTAARYSLAGQGLAKSVCKATTEEVIGPKKKHLDCEYTSHHFPLLVPFLVDVRASHTGKVSRRLFIDLESMNMMAALRWGPLGLLFCVYSASSYLHSSMRGLLLGQQEHMRHYSRLERRVLKRIFHLKFKKSKKHGEQVPPPYVYISIPGKSLRRMGVEA